MINNLRLCNFKCSSFFQIDLDLIFQISLYWLSLLCLSKLTFAPKNFSSHFFDRKTSYYLGKMDFFLYLLKFFFFYDFIFSIQFHLIPRVHRLVLICIYQLINFWFFTSLIFCFWILNHSFLPKIANYLFIFQFIYFLSLLYFLIIYNE